MLCIHRTLRSMRSSRIPASRPHTSWTKFYSATFFRCITIIFKFKFAYHGFYRHPYTITCYSICRSCHSHYFDSATHSHFILVFWNQVCKEELRQSVRCGSARDDFIFSGVILVLILISCLASTSNVSYHDSYVIPVLFILN